MQVKLSAPEIKLTQQPVQGRMFLTCRGKIRHGMQPGLKQMPLPKIIGIKPARMVMLLKDERFQTKSGGPDTCRDSGKTTSDDKKMIHYSTPRSRKTDLPSTPMYKN